MFGLLGELKSVVQDVARCVGVARHCVHTIQSAIAAGEEIPKEVLSKLLAEVITCLDEITT